MSGAVALSSAISDKVSYVGAMYSPKSKILNSATTNVFLSDLCK
jgi:hypothetical protein